MELAEGGCGHQDLQPMAFLFYALQTMGTMDNHDKSIKSHVESMKQSYHHSESIYCKSIRHVNKRPFILPSSLFLDRAKKVLGEAAEGVRRPRGLTPAQHHHGHAAGPGLPAHQAARGGPQGREERQRPFGPRLQREAGGLRLLQAGLRRFDL